jgi:hypothetical protein
MHLETPSYSERLINHLNDAKCPEIYIKAVEQFLDNEREKKNKFAAENAGVLTFGKYATRNVRDVFKLDPNYCKWLKDKSSKFLRQDIKNILDELVIEEKK